MIAAHILHARSLCVAQIANSGGHETQRAHIVVHHCRRALPHVDVLCTHQSHMCGRHRCSRPACQNGRPGQRGHTRRPKPRRAHPEPDNTACVRSTKVETLDKTITGAHTLFGRTATAPNENGRLTCCCASTRAGGKVKSVW